MTAEKGKRTAKKKAARGTEEKRRAEVSNSGQVERPPKVLAKRLSLPEPKTGALCSARRTNGMPCGAYAVRGANVCRTHGGAAEQVRRRAAVRILEASDLAARRLIAMTANEKVPYAVRLAAIRDLLDRAALNSKQSVEVQVRRFEELANSGAITIEMDFPEPTGDNVVGAELVYSPEERAAMGKNKPPANPSTQTRAARSRRADDDDVQQPKARAAGGRSRVARNAPTARSRKRKGDAS